MPSLKKIAFLDRDGVINKKQIEGRYVTSVGLFEFNKGIFEALRHLIQKGYALIVITNQRGIARGLMSEDDLRGIHERMRAELAKQGIDILDIFFCPHGFDECSCRKPKTGMLQAATEKYEIDLGRSILISDEQRDVDMGRSFGVKENMLIKIDSPGQILDYFRDRKE
jgi:D-glycero-D-manno-heptose 1,7-bisphosphate phosphatase